MASSRPASTDELKAKLQASGEVVSPAQAPSITRSATRSFLRRRSSASLAPVVAHRENLPHKPLLDDAGLAGRGCFAGYFKGKEPTYDDLCNSDC